MARIDVLDILRTKKQTPLEFDYDNLWIPPMNVYLTPQDVESLRQIATSLRLSSKIELKYKMIDDIMRNRGFKRFSAGTNRVVYSFLDDTRFVVKIAVDRVGMQDNPLEYQNQALIKPYCAKMFYISPCGTVGFAERVLPIKNKKEFKEIAPDVFDILVHRILGKYVMEDIGTRYFLNWGIRAFDSPVLLDYPFIYKLDGKKLFCNKVNPLTNEPCNGEIDYDAGFNHLVCTRCGKIYLATDLRDDSIDNKIIIKGGIQMKIVLKKGDEIISTPIPTDDVMVRPKKTPEYKKTNGLVVKISGGRKIECKKDNEVLTPPAVENEQTNSEETKTSNDEVNTNEVEGSTVNTNEVETEVTGNGENAENTNNEEVDIESDKDVEFYTKSNFIRGDEEAASETKSEESAPVAETTESKTDETEVGKPDSADVAKPTPAKKSTTSKKTTTKSTKVVNTKPEVDTPADNTDLEDKYAQYDTDDEPSYQPIRKKKSSVERDSNGRFVSSGSGKKKTNRIPSK